MAEPSTPRRRFPIACAGLILAASLAVATPVRAAPPWAVELFASGLGGLIHRDRTWGFDAGVLVQASAFRASLLAPLRFGRGGLRSRDWDERTDYGRIVGELAWGEPKDPVHVRIAAIPSLTLGVGNLVSRFASTVDVDHWRTGLVASLDFRPAGGVLFLDSVLDPRIAGGRIHVRPLFFADDRGTFGRLEIGLSLVADTAVPVGPFPGRPDAHGLPASRTGALLAGGVDLRWPVYRGTVAEVTPYGAWTRLGQADGAHAGLALDFAPHKDVRLAFQGEWRWLGRRYVASWFDDLYEVDRHDFDGVPKIIARERLGASRMGGMAGVLVGWQPYLSLGTVLEWDRRPEWRKVRADLVVTVPDRLRASAGIGVRGFATASDLVHPARRVAAVSLDVALYRTIAVFAAYSRDLEVVPVGTTSSRYAASDSVLVGLRLGLVFQGKDAAKGRKSSRDPRDR